VGEGAKTTIKPFCKKGKGAEKKDVIGGEEGGEGRKLSGGEIEEDPAEVGEEVKSKAIEIP
jgi:hypothetical protein